MIAALAPSCSAKEGKASLWNGNGNPKLAQQAISIPPRLTPLMAGLSGFPPAQGNPKTEHPPRKPQRKRQSGAADHYFNREHRNPNSKDGNQLFRNAW